MIKKTNRINKSRRIGKTNRDGQINWIIKDRKVSRASWIEKVDRANQIRRERIRGKKIKSVIINGIRSKEAEIIKE